MKGRVSQLHGKMFLLTKNMIQKIYTYHQWGICQSSFHFKNKRVVKRNEEKNNICLEGSGIICVGENAQELCSKAFGVELEDSYAYLPGVVSRKKQIVPALVKATHQI